MPKSILEAMEDKLKLIPNVIRPITLDILGSDDEIEELELPPNPKLWQTNSLLSKTTTSPPRRTPTSFGQKSTSCSPNPPFSKQLSHPHAGITADQPIRPKPEIKRNYTYTSSNNYLNSSLPTSLVIRSPIDKGFKAERLQFWLEEQKQSVSSGSANDDTD